MPNRTMATIHRLAFGLTVVWMALNCALHLTGQQYHFTHYNQGNEIPSQWVSEITQDTLGRIWLATRGGITIYNGAEWNTLTAKDLGQSEIIPVDSLIAGPDGSIWVLYSRFLNLLKLSHFQDGVWTQIPSPPFAFSAEQLWVKGVVCTDSTGIETLYLATFDAGLLTYSKQNGWNRYELDPTFKTSQITGITPFFDAILLSTPAGVFRFQDQTLFFATEINHLLSGQNIRGISWNPVNRGKSSTLWIIGKDWIASIRNGRAEISPLIIPKLDPLYFSTLPDQFGGLYLLSRQQFQQHSQLYYFSPFTKKTESFDLESGLQGHVFYSIFLDRENILWIGSSRGVSKLVSRAFKSFHSENGLLEDEVSTIFAKSPQEMIFGHNIGYTFFKDGKFVSHPFRDNPGDFSINMRVLAIDQDMGGTLYMACGSMGLLVIGPSGQRQQFTLNSPTNRNVSGVCVDAKRGKIWVANNNGLYTFAAGTFTPLTPPLTSEPGHFRNVQSFQDGTLVVSSARYGLFVNTESSWKNYLVADEPSANNVYHTLKHPDYGLLIGTAAGIYTLTQEKLVPYLFGSTSVSEAVFALAVDGEKNLWIGTQKGILLWNGLCFKRYSTIDGLPGQEANRNALVISPNGQVWIGTNGGVSIYQPQFDKPLPIPLPTVVLSELRMNQQSLSPKEPINLDYDQNSFSIRFFCPSFINEFSNTYHYRLLGYTDKWQEIKGKSLSHLYFQSLPAGTYTLEIKAANANGVWGPIARTALITVNIPFWKSTGFIVAAALLALLIPLWGVFTLSQKRHARNLENEVSGRTRQLSIQKEELERLNLELREANTSKNKFFSIIAHDLRNPFTSLLTGTEFLSQNYGVLSSSMKKKHIQEIHEAAKLTYELVNNLLDWSRTQLDRMEFVPSRIDLTRLIRQILKLLESNTIRKSLQISFLVPPRCDMLGDRHMIRFIFRNLISNAVKFTPRGGHITITVYDQTDCWTIGIQDSGMGIPADKIAKLTAMNTPTSTSGTEGERGTGLGLILCREFIALHHGQMEIESSVGQGSIFTVTLPRGNISEPQGHGVFIPSDPLHDSLPD